MGLRTELVEVKLTRLELLALRELFASGGDLSRHIERLHWSERNGCDAGARGNAESTREALQSAVATLMQRPL